MATDIWSIAKMNEICKIRVNIPYISLFNIFASNQHFKRLQPESKPGPLSS